MNPIIESLLVKFNALDPEQVENEWKEIEKLGPEVTEEKMEEIVKITPVFTAIEMINFAEYCRSGFNQYEWEEKELYDHLSDWLNKLS
jgi:hypothetical protein